MKNSFPVMPNPPSSPSCPAHFPSFAGPDRQISFQTASNGQKSVPLLSKSALFASYGTFWKPLLALGTGGNIKFRPLTDQIGAGKSQIPSIIRAASA